MYSPLFMNVLSGQPAVFARTQSFISKSELCNNITSHKLNSIFEHSSIVSNSRAYSNFLQFSYRITRQHYFFQTHLCNQNTKELIKKKSKHRENIQRKSVILKLLHKKD